jgi:hypothetical protein
MRGKHETFTIYPTEPSLVLRKRGRRPHPGVLEAVRKVLASRQPGKDRGGGVPRQYGKGVQAVSEATPNRKASIEELERILALPAEALKIEVLPSGELRARTVEEWVPVALSLPAEEWDKLPTKTRREVHDIAALLIQKEAGNSNNVGKDDALLQPSESAPPTSDVRERINKLLTRMVEDNYEENRIAAANDIGDILDATGCTALSATPAKCQRCDYPNCYCKNVSTDRTDDHG